MTEMEGHTALHLCVEEHVDETLRDGIQCQASRTHPLRRRWSGALEVSRGSSRGHRPPGRVHAVEDRIALASHP